MVDLFVAEKSRRSRLTLLLTAVVAVPLLAACGTTAELETKPVSEAPILQLKPGLLEEAEALLEMGQPKIAHLRFRQVLAAEPDNARAMLGLGEAYLALRDHGSAAAVFRDISQVDAVRARALQGYGIALLATEKRKMALKTLTEAIEIDDTLWRAWNALGMLRDYQGDWASARESYAKALAHEDAEIAMIHNNIGFSYLLEGEPAEAAKHFLSALDERPDFAVALVNLRLALAWDGKYVEAIAGADRKTIRAIMNNVGYVAMLREDYGRARAYLTRAMEVSPSFYDVAWKNLESLKTFEDLKAPRPEAASAAN